MKRLTAIFCFIIMFVPMILAQTGETVHFGEKDGLSHHHVTQILQDKDGFIWISTWNGLDRFDGRDFVTFKSMPGDGVLMPSDRFRNIAVDNHNPNIINCRVDDSWFRFSLLDGRFSPVNEHDSIMLSKNPGYGNGSSTIIDGLLHFQLRDRQGLLWRTLDDGIGLTMPVAPPINVIRWENPAEVKSISADSIGRIWVASKEDKMVRVFDNGKVFYLAPDGSLSTTPVSFGSAIYIIYQCPQTHWDVWMGSKPDGLFHLHKNGGRYIVEHISKGDGGLPAGSIYDIAMDPSGRMWLATMDGGLVCCDHGHYSQILFGRENRVRRIYVLSQNKLVATTTEGLLVVDCTPGKKITWRLHQRVPDRASSLSNNACMDFMMFPSCGNKIFVATESGGINETADGINSDTLSFRHYDRQTGLGNDVILSLQSYGGYLIAVSSNSIILINTKSDEVREFPSEFFRQDLQFSDARPLYNKVNGEWLFGLNDGIAIICKTAFNDGGKAFPIVLTSLTIENKLPDYMVNGLKEIHLKPDERTVDVAFAVLDYRNPKNIRYAYRIRGDADWHYLGNDNDIRLSELAPGDYILELRATDATGKWNPKTRELKITVEPKFTETVWFQMLIILLIIGIVVGGWLTIRYIRRIKAKQKETLDAYLALLEKTKETEKTAISSAELSSEDEAFMNRIMKFIEEHIADSDVSVDDMAGAVAMSRSSLNRKMKSLVGITPADFLREARVKRASALLTSTGETVSEIAYQCGFTDPKYFSRIFKQASGMSPSEYRTNRQKR